MVLSAGQYNSTQPSLSNNGPIALQTDKYGRQICTQGDGHKATYSASKLGLAVVASATDVFTIYGSASKTIRILRVLLSGTQTTAGTVDVQLIKRSTANSGGTSGASTAVPHDSASAAASGSVLSYTANPAALGTAVGTIRADKVFFAAPATASQASLLIHDFGNRPGQAVVLRGTGEGLAVNLNGVTVAGGNLDISIEWSEE